MKYSGLIKNDFSAAPGASVTLFVSGCHLHCPGCHNPEAQDFNYGQTYTIDTTHEIIDALQANGINRTLCIMGGEPLAWENRDTIRGLIMDVKYALPNTPVYIWTGYTYEWLQNEIINGAWPEPDLKWILANIDVLIDGPYIQEERDVTLRMRGSRNQRILHLKQGEIIDVEK